MASLKNGPLTTNSWNLPALTGSAMDPKAAWDDMASIAPLLPQPWTMKTSRYLTEVEVRVSPEIKARPGDRRAIVDRLTAVVESSLKALRDTPPYEIAITITSKATVTLRGFGAVAHEELEKLTAALADEFTRWQQAREVESSLG